MRQAPDQGLWLASPKSEFATSAILTRNKNKKSNDNNYHNRSNMNNTNNLNNNNNTTPIPALATCNCKGRTNITRKGQSTGRIVSKTKIHGDSRFLRFVVCFFVF